MQTLQRDDDAATAAEEATITHSASRGFSCRARPSVRCPTKKKIKEVFNKYSNLTQFHVKGR